MRILGIPVIWHYVQFRFYFASKVALPIAKLVLSSNPPEKIKSACLSVMLWNIDVLMKTIQWKLSKIAK